MSNYDLLIQKLDRFIRKYYLNQLIKGTLYTIGVVVGLFVLLNLLEHQFYFTGGVRKVLFFGFLSISGIAAIFWVLNPLTKYFKLGKVIDHEQAASIIGDHFSSVKDKLLNILQLKKQSEDTRSSDLIEASINQKTEAIKLVPFKSAIDLKGNRKYLKYALPPALMLLVILFAAPSLITEPTHRLINNDKEFERAAPFHFHLNNGDLEVVQSEDIVVTVDIDGEALPDEVFIDVDKFQYRMKKVDASTFSYTFKDVQKDVPFHFYSGTVKSTDHKINVLLKPNLTEFNLKLNYPAYIGRKNETLSNIGDLVVPEGTSVTWNFAAENTDELALVFGNSKNVKGAEQRGKNEFYFKKRITQDELYKIYVSNNQVPQPDSIIYSVNVIKDQYPQISVETFVDSLEKTLIYFIGNASDDYGISSLNFNYTITKSNGQQNSNVVAVDRKSGRDVQYDYTFDISELELKPGDQLSYFFEVKDNDGVNGAKASKTGLMTFEKPTVEEFEEQEDANEEDIKDKLKDALEESKKIQEELKRLREKMLQKQEPSWEDKKALEKLMERQKEIQEEIKKAQEKFQENIENQEEFTERSEEIKEKQEKMEELFEEALDDETMELMEKIQDLMEELNKDQMLENMQQMEMQESETETEMDRLLELFKSLEVEKEMKDLTEALEELAEKQEELANDTEEQKKSQEQLEKEQEELNKEMEKLEEQLEELEKKNEDLERPKDMGSDNKEQMDDIQEDMEQSQEQLEQKQNKGASQKQKQAADKMKKMASKMSQAMESGQMEQMQEDIKALRQLLENLVTLSFDQEDLINALKRTQKNTPKYVKHIQGQFKLKDDFQLIQDSLVALAKRNDKIESFVNEKILEVKVNLQESIDQLEERKKSEAEANQRHTMKNVNDLALMLSESMEQMQQDMSGMMSGSQMCNKPNSSGGKPGQVPMDKITKGQQDLNNALKKMSGEGKPGKDGKDGKGGKDGKASSKEFAKAAARQAALRRALEELQKEKSEQGKGSEELQKIIDQMDKIEIDLVNKKLDNDLMLRQQDIITRLLQAEKADRQREKDEKRKAESGEDKKKELPAALKEYLKEREAEIEMYKEISPSLRPFYKQLVDEYYKALKKQ